MKKWLAVVIVAILAAAYIYKTHMRTACGYIEGKPGFSRSLVMCTTGFVWG